MAPIFVNVSIKSLLKIYHLKKIQIHLQLFLLFRNTSYSVFKEFLGIFIDYIDFKLLEYVKTIPFELFFNTKPNIGYICYGVC
jgi:hypothetical protein